MDIRSVIESIRKQTETAHADALHNERHWRDVRLKAEGGLIMLGELERVLSEPLPEDAGQSDAPEN